MSDYHEATRVRWDHGLAGLVLAGVLCTGCGSSSTVEGLLDAEQAEATASSAHTSAALGAMALEASLNQIDAANFAPLSSPPVVAAQGNPTAGTVTVDFGSGTMVNNATVSGTMMASYTVTGGTAVTVTVTFAGLTANTSAGGAAVIGGSLTLTGVINGSSNAAGTLTGAVTATTMNDTTTVTPNLTYAVDGTLMTGDITLNGTIDLDSSLYGEWEATLTTLNGTVSQATRTINSGELELERESFPSVTATMTFTGANTGMVVVTPSGYSRNFTL